MRSSLNWLNTFMWLKIRAQIHSLSGPICIELQCMLSIGLSHTHTHSSSCIEPLGHFKGTNILHMTYAIFYTNILASVIVKFCLVYYEIQILLNTQQSTSKKRRWNYNHVVSIYGCVVCILEYFCKLKSFKFHFGACMYDIILKYYNWKAN